MQRSRLFWLFLVSLVFMLALPGLASAKQRIGVVPFENGSQIQDPSFGNNMADLLITELMKNGNFEVVTRTQMEQLFREQRRGAMGIVDDATAAQMGKILGVKYMILGKVLNANPIQSERRDQKTGEISTSVSTSILINVKMIDVETAQIIFSENAEDKPPFLDVNATSHRGHPKPISAFSFADFAKRAQRVTVKVAGMINDYAPIEGLVINVSPNGIMIDIGHSNGIRAGQKFTVMREGAPIRHPVTGALLAVEKTEIATITIIKTDPNTAVGKINKKGDIKVGDIVRRTK